MSEQRQDVAPIVVGVDGPILSLTALRWAVEHARRTGADIHAVTGWEVPFTIMIVPTYTEADYARDARQVLDRAVAEIQDSATDVRIEKHLPEAARARADRRRRECAAPRDRQPRTRRAAWHAPGLGGLLLRPLRPLPGRGRARTPHRPLTAPARRGT